jgi:hypothetical protein
MSTPDQDAALCFTLGYIVWLIFGCGYLLADLALPFLRRIFRSKKNTSHKHQ